MFNREKVEPKLKELPLSPGVYIMRNRAGEIIYIGKAVNLKRRVSQYFGTSKKPIKVQAMVDKVDDFSYIITLSEADALTLEATLIKKHMPRYNILLKDDKGRGVYIKVTPGPFPSAHVTRNIKKDGSKYYGPFSGGISARDILQAMKTVYGIRTCRGEEKRPRECLDWHLGLCTAPCTGKISIEDYSERLKSAEAFLSGKTEEAEAVIESKMLAAAESEDFERAISLRTILSVLKSISGRKLSGLNMRDGDVFAYVSDGVKSAVCVMPVRSNKLFPAGTFLGEDAGDDIEALSSFIVRYYSSRPIPQDIYVNLELTSDGLESVLSLEKGSKVNICCPVKGQKKDIIKTAEENCREALIKFGADQARKEEMTFKAAEKLAEILGIDSARRIECYDISHISGTDKVASGVCFINGDKALSEYRRYKIKTVEGNNDFACMAEVLSRRLARAEAGDESFKEMPDLIVIDGGLGQLHAAAEIMRRSGFNIPMVGLAKRFEEIYTLFSSEPILLPKDSASLKLLQRVRDEAHRFAITYNRNQRLRRVRSELDSISGIGEKKSKLLLTKFGSVEEIKKLPVEVLASVKGMTRPAAEAVYRHFHVEKTD